MKEKLVSHDDLRNLHPVLQGKYGDLLIDWAIKIAGLNVANEIYDRSKHLTGPAFCTDLLNKLNIKRIVRNDDILEPYRDKPFITVSNHPYGHIDGIAAIETVGTRVNHYKMMVNFILGLIDTMGENFITVNPYGENKTSNVTLGGLKQCISHIEEGYPLGFFPAGTVSDLHLKRGKPEIIDREWQKSVIKFIQRADVPVIPMHISGRNSYSFYLSKIFGVHVRTMRLCHELYNKKGKEIILTLGTPILPREIKEYPDIKALGEFLKAKTYALGKK